MYVPSVIISKKNKKKKHYSIPSEALRSGALLYFKKILASGGETVGTIETS